MSITSGPLPEEGPEREIFINALQDYRNSCEAPELTPRCPFFTWTSNGPACGEQCADLLAQYGGDEDEDSTDLGGGIVVMRARPRRRPRHGPTSAVRPFDARQVYLDDDHRPHADRRTVALIVELTELISMPPSQSVDIDERAYDIGAAMDQLRSRDFDVDALIRYGIGAILPVHFAVHLLLPMMTDVADNHAISGPIPSTDMAQPSEEWLKFFRDSYNLDVSEPFGKLDTVYYALHGFLDRIRSWLETAQIDDIVAWRAPAQPLDRLATAARADRRDTANTAKWIRDRFMSAGMSDWLLSSLHLEWLYIHGRLQAPCSTTSMAERRVGVQEISNEIAQRTSQDWRRGSARDSGSDLASSFVSVAADHLRNGKPEVAAAIFEAVLSISSDNSEARNNYAFCLLPTDPAKALNELEKADSSQDASLTTLANRVLALHLLGRDDNALALGTSQEARDRVSPRGLMWLVDEDHVLRLSDWIDVRRYLQSLLTHIEGERTKEALPG